MATLLGADRWVTVRRDDDEMTSKHRHLVRKGAATSACGTTALPESIWKADSRRPKCPRCVEKEAARAGKP